MGYTRRKLTLLPPSTSLSSSFKNINDQSDRPKALNPEAMKACIWVAVHLEVSPLDFSRIHPCVLGMLLEWGCKAGKQWTCEDGLWNHQGNHAISGDGLCQRAHFRIEYYSNNPYVIPFPFHFPFSFPFDSPLLG